ncbi:MAG: hypothetical protein M0017_03960 [Desulfobacteraceae bacterium]|nr:hypothetical protein [Desulfobacteraceae bacterium]
MQRIRSRLCLFLGGLMLALIWAPAAFATVDWEAGRTISPGKAPLDVAGSADGRWTFVLTEGGKINIYSSEDGKLNDTIPVDPTMDRINVPGLGDKIIVSSSKAKKVQEILVDFVVNIPTAGSPFLGPANAPVEMVVFSDFQ